MAIRCIRHSMPNGTIMNGPPHGPGQQCVEWSNGGGYKKGGRVRKKNKGGLLKGPSHARGGIQARLQGGGGVELEGGEYIVNAQTVKAVGEQFLDQLNSTATTYHKGGYSRGQLPNPSNYKQGGKIMSRRKRMAAGGRPKGLHRGGRARKRFQTGGHAHRAFPYQHSHQQSMKHTHPGGGNPIWDYQVAQMDEGNDGPPGYNISSTGPEWQGNKSLKQSVVMNPNTLYSATESFPEQWSLVSSAGTHGHAGRLRSQQQFKRGGKSMVRTRMARGGRTRKMRGGGSGTTMSQGSRQFYTPWGTPLRGSGTMRQGGRIPSVIEGGQALMQKGGRIKRRR